MNHATITNCWRMLAITPLLAITLAACGSTPATGTYANTDPAAPTTNVATNNALDACTLITQNEAADALGQAASAPKHGAVENAGDATSALVSTCNYNATDADSLASVSLLVRRAPTDENTPAAIDAVRETVKGLGSTTQDVPGLGNTAFWGAHQLHVFSGGRTYLIVSMFGMQEDAGALDRAQQVAKLILARL